MMSVVGSYCVLGPVQTCIERLAEYIEAGARHIIFSWHTRAGDIDRQIALTTQQIIPALRARFAPR